LSVLIEKQLKPSVDIRAFVAADLQGVFDLILPIQQVEFSIPISADDQPDLSNIESFYQCGKGGFWVAVAEAKIVGTIGLKDIGNGQAALRKMFVAPGSRGKDAGIAALLLDWLVGEATKQGVGEILLGTTAKFLAAHRFYEKNGFTQISAATLPPAFPRMAVDTVFYGRSLAENAARQSR